MIRQKSTSCDFFTKELKEFKDELKTSGIPGALRYFNSRTPHRYTGIYRYDRDTLRNIAVYDKYDPGVMKGDDAPMEVTYCSLLANLRVLQIDDANTDMRVKGKINTAVVSYCGVPMRDPKGNTIGSLCNFDMKRCQERSYDIPLLETAADLLYEYIYVDKKCVEIAF